MLILGIILSINSYSQKFHLDKDSHLLSVDTVVTLNDSIKVTKIYSNIKKWIVDTYKNAEKVTVSDLENEQITLRYIKGFKSSGVVNDYYCTMQIKMKDNKFKLVLNSISDVKSNTPIESTFIKKDGSMRLNSVTNKLILQFEEELINSSKSIYSKLISPEEKW